MSVAYGVMRLFRFVIKRTGANQYRLKRNERRPPSDIVYFAVCFRRFAHRAFILSACAFRAAAVHTRPFFAEAGAALAPRVCCGRPILLTGP
jgi:hypothetical protein